VALNILRPQNVGLTNMRTFELPAQGAIPVTVGATSQPGLSAAVVDAGGDLSAIDDLLSSPDSQIRELSSLVQERVRPQTYARRAAALLE
jgi:hypothetical protein